MQVIPICAFTDNYIWLIVNNNKEALCVDPGDARPVLKYLGDESIELKGILLTHHHYDHVGGVSELIAKKPGINVYGPKDERIPYVNNYLGDGDLLSILSCNFNIISTSGHTSTHISYYEPYYGWLFCGDTLFSGGCGRVFDGTLEDLFNSLNKLKSLPEETKVFCAHEYTNHNLQFAVTVEPDNQIIANYLKNLTTQTVPSKIGLEKKINPFLRTDLKNLQVYACKNGIKTLDPFTIFKHLRQAKDFF